jgi:hypothetical protein
MQRSQLFFAAIFWTSNLFTAVTFAQAKCFECECRNSSEKHPTRSIEECVAGCSAVGIICGENMKEIRVTIGPAPSQHFAPFAITCMPGTTFGGGRLLSPLSDEKCAIPQK